MLILTSLAVHMPIQRHMYISTPLHEEANIHFFGYWMKCILVLVIWGATFFWIFISSISTNVTTY